MSKKFPAPAAFAKHPRPAIPLHQVESSQIHSMGYDEATKELAVRFHHSDRAIKHGGDAIYHYPNVSKEQHAAFVGAKSLGTHFGQHLKRLPFKKFRADEDASAEHHHHPKP